MKYYVIADPHAFLRETKAALEKNGFFEDCETHMLVVLGDVMDRGEEAVEMQAFLMQLLREGRLILIRGNHEDLFEAMITDIARGLPVGELHEINGTWDTAVQLSGLDKALAARYAMEVARRVRETDYWRVLLPAAVDYFETDHYVFLHGWLPGYSEPPLNIDFNGELHCRCDWRDATTEEWRKARWVNGMECACLSQYGLRDKSVVCGHWKTSYGHAVINRQGTQEGDGAIYTPFYAKGIIALDACTVCSGFVNCIVLED